MSQSNSNQVFIQSRQATNNLQQISQFERDKDTPQHLKNIEEMHGSEINLVHKIRQFPQTSAYGGGGNTPSNALRQDTEAGETNSIKVEDHKEQIRISKFQQFKERSLMKQPTQFRKEENQEKEEEQEMGEDNAVQDINLKYGDIIYFKFYREQSKGIISGDGIAGNKLECISIGDIIYSGSEEHFNHEQDLYEFDEDKPYLNPNDDPNMANKQILNKRASIQFRKCLFRVTNSKKYYYQNLYNIEKKNVKQGQGFRNKNQQQKLSDIEQKMREEQEDNERAYQQKLGTNVIYGQEIQLEHIYSKCRVTLNPDVLAYEHCCRELSLEEIPSQWSNFIINSSNNAKKTGEPVMYKEQISIYSSENPYYWVNIQQSSYISTGDENQEAITNLFDEGQEVNCTDRSVPLKLNLYLSISDQQEREKAKAQSENKGIQIGDVVYIYNRIVKGRIGVQRKNLASSKEQSQFQMKKVEIILEANDDFNQQKSLPIQVLKVEDYTKNISDQYELFIDTEEEENRIETLWEVQRMKNFKSEMATYDENIRIRNVWTGLYLYLNENDEISLTLEGNLDKTFFHIKPKRFVQLIESTLIYQQPVKILQQLQHQTIFIRIKEDPYEEDEFLNKKKQKIKGNMFGRNQCKNIDEADGIKQQSAQPVCAIVSYHVKKDRRGEIEFELLESDTKLMDLADRVSSLFPYLMNFYVFLLQWGNKITKKENGVEEWRYEYHTAFEQQKYLYNYVQQLYQSIENLNDFLKQDSNLNQRQKILLDAGIVEIILLILKLIHYKIYCHCELDTINQSKDQRNINDYKMNIPDKTAQKIASIKLLKTIGVLYDILIKCIQGNSETSSFVLKMQKDNFLFNQIKYHKTEVVQLLKEATRYIDGDQKEQNKENMRKWVNKIQQITANNIQEQTFIIELLCLSITDHLEQPIVEYQSALRKLLFSRPRNLKDDDENYYKETSYGKDRKYTGYLKRSHLISFKIENDNPFIIFNLQNPNNKNKFETDNPDLYYLPKKGANSSLDPNFINHFPFDHINGAMAKGKSTPTPSLMLEKYEVYVLEILNLYALLSAGRNQKSIKCLSSIGLTKTYIYKCLQSRKIDNNHLRQYRSILNLYDSFILNVPPFIPISNYHNLVFQNIDFKDFNPKEQPSYTLFREIVVNQETKSQIRDEYQKLTDNNQETNESKLLQLYAKLIVDREEQQYKESKNNNDSKQISSLKIQEELIIYDPLEKDKVIDKLNHENIFKINKNADRAKLSKFMMETFHQMLKITKTRVNLGYNTPEQNQRILDIIPNLFFALIDFKEQIRENVAQNDLTEIAVSIQKKQQQKQSHQRFNKNWIYNFMLYNLEFIYDDLITTKIFIEAITIVNIINKLNMYLYIVELIQFKRSEFTNDCLEFFYQFKFSLEDVKKISESKSVNLSVLIMQTMEYLRRDPILENTMFKTLIKNFDYLKDLQNQTVEVEIIEDLQEIEIYKDVNGITENNQNQRSPQDIKQLVFKTIQYFQFLEVLINEGHFMIKASGLEEEQLKIYEQKQNKLGDLEKNYDQLNQAIDYCISLFSKKMALDNATNKQNHYILQLQNIFRHSRIPEYLLNLFKQVPQYNSVFIEFYRKIIQFFYLFTKNNPTNKRRILEFITPIMNLCLIPNENIVTPEKLADRTQVPIQPIKISKLCIKLLEDIKTDSTLIKDIINQIVILIEDNIPFNVDRDKVKGQNWKAMKYKIYRYGVSELKCLALIQYFKILKSLTISETRQPIQSNQLQILNNFMHKKMLSDIVQPIIESYLTKFGIKFDNQSEFLKLKLHSQGVILLSACCKDFKIGIQEIQRFVMFDTLKAIVVSQQAPFILKRAYLKCLFEAYVNKVYDLEKDSSNETISNIELNDMLTSEIIPILALSTSYKYLQGLIINKENKRESENLKSLRDNVRRNKYKLFKSNKEYEKAIWADDQKKADSESENMPESGIVKDISEYWKYLFKEGVIHFIIDSYDEFTDVISNDLKEGDHQGSVNSNFQIIGNYLQKLLEQIEIVEKEFKVISIQQRTYVDFELMRNSLEIIPIGNPKKMGTHFIIDKNKDHKNQVIKMNANAQEQQSEIKQEMNLQDFNRDPEFVEVQKQFKLQLIRKRISLQDFLIQFYVNFQECKAINKALFQALNVQKIIYTPSQVNYMLKRFCNYEQAAPSRPSNFTQLGKRKMMSQQQDLEDQLKQVIGCLYALATKNAKNEAVQEALSDSNALGNIIKNQKRIRTQQAQIDQVKVQFGKIIRTFIKEQLNILKKSVIDEEIEIQLRAAKDDPTKLEQLKGKYSQDIDNCISDYEVYVKSNEEEANGEKTAIIKSKTLTTTQGILPGGGKDSSKDVKLAISLEDEEEELGKIEKTYLDRMLIDSQITLFLRDIQAELNIYGINLGEENESKEEDDDDEFDQQYTYQASSEINPQRRIFQSYIQLFSQVFSGQRYYLVKIVRLLLEAVQIDDLTMSKLTSTHHRERRKAQEKFDLLQLCQSEVANEEIFIHALKFIKVTSTYDELQEGLTFMICMLNRGNQFAQNAVLEYLKRDTDALVDFFSFLRNFFNQEISQQIKAMYDQQNVSDIPSEFEILSLKILRLIQLFCENVNENFQLFLMKQSDDENSFLSNYNVTLEVSTFLSIFLEDDLLQMSRKQNIIIQCIDTLNECISGQQQVLECVARNKRLFIYLNEKIIRQKRLSFKPIILNKPTEQQLKQHAAYTTGFKKNLELFMSAMKFMLTIVSGIPNSEDLDFLLEQVQTDRLIVLLDEIYEYRIRPKQDHILMGQECKHQNKNSGKLYICNEDYCFENNITPLEQLIISIGFSIFILFYYIRDLFPDNQAKLLAFHLDEKKDLEISLDLTDFGIPFLKKTQTKKIQSDQVKQEQQQPAQKKKSLKNQLMKIYHQKKITIEEEQEDQSIEKEEQEEESDKDKKVEEEKLYEEDVNEKMSARKLLYKGLTHVILKDIANLEKGELSEEQKEQNEIGLLQKIRLFGDVTLDEEFDNTELCSDKNRPYFKFFKYFIGSVEVKNQHEQIKKVYFQKPFYTKFLTPDIKKHLIYSADRDSDTERLMFLIDHITYYEEQMIHKQSISQWGIFSYVADKWRLYKQLSYYLVVALTIITLSTYGQVSENGNNDIVDSTNNEDVKNTFMIVSYIQLLLSFAILVSCAIERFPISVYRNIQSQMYETIQKHKRNSGFPDDSLSSVYNQISNKLYNYFSTKNAKSKTYVKFLLVCFDKENIYNLVYLIITGFAFQNNLIYAFLLLDIIKRSEDLQNVISSITKNALNLIKFSFLGIVIMYIYGIIGYQSFQKDYDGGSGGISDTFILTITSTIKEGLRNGGGVADSMSAVEYSSESFWSRYFFDLTFFIVINMLFIQIIFGIILDTFGELRDNRSELLQLVRETCFICGLSRRYIEANSEEDWHHHIYMEHNCYNLLFYMIYVKRKSENDCDALEKYIKKCLEKNNDDDKSEFKPVDFIPLGESLSIEKFRNKEKEPDNHDEEQTEEES